VVESVTRHFAEVFDREMVIPSDLVPELSNAL
jgi:hypothetical protein